MTELVSGLLRDDGFDVRAACDGETAIDLARSFDPDVVVLDLGLPGLDGIETCQRLRQFSTAYIVMLTARSDEIDKVVGLSAGADDYVTKPFGPRELVARVRALLRRPRADPAPSQRVFGPLVIDPAAREVTVAGRAVALTRIEFDLLDALSAEARVVFSRTRLLERVWGPNWVGDPHVVDVHMSNLRRKLEETGGAGSFVATVRGVGYRMAGEGG
jgi:DNA-binding response OmpR family regulator